MSVKNYKRGRYSKSMFKPEFKDLPKNPVRLFREDQLKFNIAQLAREANISPQTIRDVELGLPKTIPDKLLEYFDRQSPGNSIDVKYNQWKDAKRAHVFLPPVGLLSISSDKHPMQQYREKIGGIRISALCEYLCVPRFVLINWETQQKKMPSLLQTAFVQAHLTQHDVDKLANLGEMSYIAREQARINEQRQLNSRIRNNSSNQANTG